MCILKNWQDKNYIEIGLSYIIHNLVRVLEFHKQGCDLLL